jgi:membrane protease YdiL (CAAX protease family)
MRESGLAGTACMVFAAIGITTAMDAHGLSDFSALPLLPLAALGWWLGRYSRQAMGIAWGRSSDYLLAAAWPVAVLGTIGIGAWAMGLTDFGATDWSKAVRNLALMAIATIPAAILTEEGFFRGWLVASLERQGFRQLGTLVCSSIAFALWHVSAVTIAADFMPPAAQIPVYLANAAVMGAIWCVMRMRSGSIVVSSVSHGLWNGGAYVLFGYGQKVGALGIADTAFFGPENGLLGLALNLVFLAAVVRWPLSRRSRCGQASRAGRAARG